MSETADTKGKSPHAFMLEALGVQSRLLEQRRTLITAALAAEHNAIEHAAGYRSADVDAYFQARATRQPARRPQVHAWRK